MEESSPGAVRSPVAARRVEITDPHRDRQRVAVQPGAFASGSIRSRSAATRRWRHNHSPPLHVAVAELSRVGRQAIMTRERQAAGASQSASKRPARSRSGCWKRSRGAACREARDRSRVPLTTHRGPCSPSSHEGSFASRSGLGDVAAHCTTMPPHTRSGGEGLLVFQSPRELTTLVAPSRPDMRA